MTTTAIDATLHDWITSHREQSHGMTRAVTGHRHQVRDLTGQRFGRLVAFRYTGPHKWSNGNSSAEWECRCDCGNTVRIPGTSLTRGLTRSCGCLRRDHTRNWQHQWKDQP